MNKISLIIQREYFSRVRKRSFLITTILVPIIIIGFYVGIIAIAVSDNTEKTRVAVIDDGQLFNGKVSNADRDKSVYVIVPHESEESFRTHYRKDKFDYFLYIPPIADPAKFDSSIRLHSESAISITQKSAIEKTINKAVEQKRLQTVNISPEQFKAISADVNVETRIDKGKDQKSGGIAAAYIVSFACGILIYMVLMIYGTMVMRGVMEEKMNRIAEVIVSSVKPFQLMLGKIIGIGAVGLTQFAIWIVLIGLLMFAVPLVVPGFAHAMAEQAAANPGAANTNAMASFAHNLSSIPIGLILFCFIFYFIGGYLMYASLFAAIGSVISEDQQEAQQLVFPVLMPIILGFMIMTKAVMNPNSSIAVFGSLFPLTSPIVMMGRIMYDVPPIQLIGSMLLLVLTFILFTWLTAKIYRTGILLYGKKVTWKEMVRWAFRKN